MKIGRPKNLGQETYTLSVAQLDLASTLAVRHGLDIPRVVLADYAFGKQFIELFSYDPDRHETTGFRRVAVIESYIFTDKDPAHLQSKLDLSYEQVTFMISVLSQYKYHGALPRENLSDPDPVSTSFDRLEQALFEETFWQ